jgi:hypothetical protein
VTRALPEELECQDVVEVVSDYIDDALPIQQRTKLEHHLVYCTGCATYTRQLRDQKKAFSVEGAHAITPAERAKLFGAFHKWKAGRPG